MSYISKQPAKDLESVQRIANALISPTFSDQRASTAVQLKQQQMMHSAHLPNVIQQLSAEEDEPLQGEFENEASAQLQEASAENPNNTGLPDNLKSGIESLSGYSMDNVKVHYNSDKPAQLNAHAYAQGTDIHVAPDGKFLYVFAHFTPVSNPSCHRDGLRAGCLVAPALGQPTPLGEPLAILPALLLGGDTES